ncbi:MAG: Maf family protein [Vicinamibacteria bacterium]
MKRLPLILASSSPRRAAFLRELGFSFRRVAPEVDETRLRGESPMKYVSRLAATKANAVAERYPGRWVVGADTAVVVNGKLLGKPSDRRDAARMLKLLSGRSHRVFSGIGLARDRVLHVATSSTRVVFRPLTADVIQWYVRTGEPMDKAGAYGIQGKGGLLVARIEGSFSNVAGFPLERFFELWKDAGLPLP